MAKGKKNCPGCSQEIGARNLVCPNCKHSFGVAVKEPLIRVKLEKTFEEQIEPVRPASSVSSAPLETAPPRYKNLVVTEGFSSRPSRVEPTEIHEEKNVVFAPAGQPPSKPSSLTEEGISEWVEKMQEKFGFTYRKQALTYWSRYFVDIHSKEYQTVKQIIEMYA